MISRGKLKYKLLWAVLGCSLVYKEIHFSSEGQQLNDTTSGSIEDKAYPIFRFINHNNICLCTYMNKYKCMSVSVCLYRVHILNIYIFRLNTCTVWHPLAANKDLKADGYIQKICLLLITSLLTAFLKEKDKKVNQGIILHFSFIYWCAVLLLADFKILNIIIL